MIKDIIVTTPKTQMEIATKEAEDCLVSIRKGDPAHYFRRFLQRPQGLNVGTRIFYVEDGYVRGFAKVCEVVEAEMICESTGRKWGRGTHAIMNAKSWKWIKPIKMRGFQGWRYSELGTVQVVGNYLKPKPE